VRLDHPCYLQNCPTGCLYNVSADPGEHGRPLGRITAAEGGHAGELWAWAAGGQQFTARTLHAPPQARIAELEATFFNNNEIVAVALARKGHRYAVMRLLDARHRWAGSLAPTQS